MGVSIGKVGLYAVNFVADDVDTIKYYQVSKSIQNQSVKNRGIKSFWKYIRQLWENNINYG